MKKYSNNELIGLLPEARTLQSRKKLIQYPYTFRTVLEWGIRKIVVFEKSCYKRSALKRA